MNTREIQLKSYQDMLDEINNQECHLLLGNGFNNSLGVGTSYENIFNKMKEEYSEYSKVEEMIRSKNYDIEYLISKLTTKVKDDETGDFLKKYIANKVKSDFMKAANTIVTKQIKNIYQEKNKGIYLLLKNFKNYFTLNYDILLYLLLMKFKKNDEKVVAFQNTTLFQMEDLNQRQNGIHDEIKTAYEQGSIAITVGDSSVAKNLNDCKKSEFTIAVKNYFWNKNWPPKDIERSINLLWKEKMSEESLENINDGFYLFKNEEYVYRNPETQNIFFLHGSFHIYKDKKQELIKKITQNQDKALYERLEKIINSEEKEIICILAGESDEKKQEIEENTYLKKSLEKLSNLSGKLVILGSCLGENDKHIFEQITRSSITSIYISTCPNKKEEDDNKARNIFPDKEIILFDHETISY